MKVWTFHTAFAVSPAVEEVFAYLSDPTFAATPYGSSLLEEVAIDGSPLRSRIRVKFGGVYVVECEPIDPPRRLIVRVRSEPSSKLPADFVTRYLLEAAAQGTLIRQEITLTKEKVGWYDRVGLGPAFYRWLEPRARKRGIEIWAKARG